MPYRVQPRLKIGPAAIRRFDPTKYLERIDAATASSNSALLAAQQRAALRKTQEQEAQKQEQIKAQADAQARMQERLAASQDRTKKLKEATAVRSQITSNRVTAQLQAENSKQKRFDPIGASAVSGANPSFNNNMGISGVVPTNVAASSKAAAGIINEALKYRGRMYQWGGSNPRTSFDCSGLVQWAYKSMGVALPRVSSAQANSGRKVPLSALRPGDLVAWDNSSRNQGADHIAIYIGNGQILEAPRRGSQISVRQLGRERNAWGVQILR